MRRSVIVLALTVTLVGCSAGGGTTTSPTGDAFDVQGAITVEAALGVGGTACHTDGGYADIAAGTDVVVTDAHDVKVAVGRLSDGKFDGPYRCVFAFVVSDVPPDVGPYSVEVGHRGEVTYTEDELRGQSLSLTLN